jgi:hypothetical protein
MASATTVLSVGEPRMAEPDALDGSQKPGRIWNLTANIWSGAVWAVVVVGLGIAAVTYGVITPYGYWVGTPAKAAVEHCELHGKFGPDSSPDLDCTGTWTVGGQSHTGPIKPPFRENEQDGIHAGKSVLDVHVHDGTAYTALAVKGKGFYVALAIGIGLLGWGSFRLRKAWRGRNRG